MLRNRSRLARGGSEGVDELHQHVLDLLDRAPELRRDLLGRPLKPRPASLPPRVALRRQPDEVRATVLGMRDSLHVAGLDHPPEPVGDGGERRTRPLSDLAGRERPPDADHAQRPVEPAVDALRREVALEQRRDELTGDPDVDQEAARPVGRRVQAARRSCSSSGTSGRPKISAALVSVTTLSPASSIFSRSRVSGMSPGRRSVTSAFTFIRPTGTWMLGRPMPRIRFTRSQNSFHDTASGPPTSNVLSIAASRSTARAKYAPMSSAQIGWIRCVPLPMIGVTGASLASLRKVGRIPPSFPKTKLGRKTTYGMPAAFTSCSISHLAW